MFRSLTAVAALSCAAAILVFPAASGASGGNEPMHFALRQQGPAQVCGATCVSYVVASGPITADTPIEFRNFAKNLNLKGALVVLDSEGGSVHGAMALGREIRSLGLDTTVGHVTDMKAIAGEAPRGIYDPHADCESMCSFVLLAGVHRTVPVDARVMVHQIWLGDRREDPTAATYSAEDLVLVQRDIGKLAIYTAEMGGSMEMLDLALRIPPWEPMHTMTRAEIDRMGVETVTSAAKATVATSQAAADAAQAQVQPVKLLNGPTGFAEISERTWAVVDQAGTASIARRHPLTVQGEDIGSFDLHVSCSADGGYNAVYVEHRHEGDDTPLPRSLRSVTLRSAGGEAKLKIAASNRHDADDLVTYATGTMPAGMIDGFGAQGDHSLYVETKANKLFTSIRLGNTGVSAALPRLAAACAVPSAQPKRADLGLPKTGAIASAK